MKEICNLCGTSPDEMYMLNGIRYADGRPASRHGPVWVCKVCMGERLFHMLDYKWEGLTE